MAALPLSHPSSETPQVPRLLIVDDSVVIRSVVERIVADAGKMHVVAKVAQVDAAIAYLNHNEVDVVLLDHELPGQNGLDALPDVLAAARGARVAIMSGHCEEGSEAAVRALALGASDIIAKPHHHEYSTGFSEMLVQRLLRLAAARVQSHELPGPVGLRPVPTNFRPLCIGIGASTGGIHALSTLLSNMPRRPGVPILVTQHLPTTFVPYFARQLAPIIDMPVKLAQDGEPLQPDRIYIAPGECNLCCERGFSGISIKLTPDRASPNHPLPGVDPMLSSMAQTYGRGAVGIVLTGMGRDGMIGAQHVVETGGLVIAQDQKSSVVWGMPGSVARSGSASALLPPEKIMDFIESLSGYSS